MRRLALLVLPIFFVPFLAIPAGAGRALPAEITDLCGVVTTTATGQRTLSVSAVVVGVNNAVKPQVSFDTSYTDSADTHVYSRFFSAPTVDIGVGTHATTPSDLLVPPPAAMSVPSGARLVSVTAMLWLYSPKSHSPVFTDDMNKVALLPTAPGDTVLFGTCAQMP